MDRTRYEPLDHTADLGLRIYGDTLDALFANAGYALFDNLCDLSTVREQETTEVFVSAPAADELLHRWLSELLQTYSIKHYLFTRFEVLAASDTELRARLHGEAYDESRHGALGEIKAVTYHELSVTMKDDGWEAQVIFDV
ncbi:MAG: archease [Planctomycetes bacterium]|nr:archease [Planctomycetota bacterium]